MSIQEGSDQTGFHSGPLALYTKMKVESCKKHRQRSRAILTHQDSDQQLQHILFKLESNPKDTPPRRKGRRGFRQMENCSPTTTIQDEPFMEGREPEVVDEEEKENTYTRSSVPRYEMDDGAKVFMSLRKEKMKKRRPVQKRKQHQRQRQQQQQPMPTPTPTPTQLSLSMPNQRSYQMVSELELTRGDSMHSMSSCSLDSALQENPWLALPPPPPPPPRPNCHHHNPRLQQNKRKRSSPKAQKLEEFTTTTARFAERLMNQIKSSAYSTCRMGTKLFSSCTTGSHS